jgi:hypothetical protein
MCFRVLEEEASKVGLNLSGAHQLKVCDDLITKNINMNKGHRLCGLQVRRLV